MNKALRLFLCSCMVAVGSITLSGCGDSKGTATPAAEEVPQPPATEMEFSKEKNIKAF